jgi:hypothetical protein
MNTNILLVFMVFLLAYQAYSTMSLKDKIFCTFYRANKTKIEKWAKDKQRLIDFDGGWYEVDPSCIVLQLKWNPLPVWIRASTYRFDSPKPLNPSSFDNRYTPDERKQLDKADDIRELQVGNNRAVQGSKQKVAIGGFLPIIILIGFVIVGFMLWQQGSHINQIGNGQNAIESMLSQLLQK